MLKYVLNRQTHWPGIYLSSRGWSSDAMVLGKLQMPRHPTIWMIVGKGHIALAVGACGDCLDILISSGFSLLFFPLYGRRPDCLKEPLYPKQPTNQLEF